MSEMPAQQLFLSWTDHNAALVSVFENLLKRNTLVDCTLAAEGQYLKAHKVVLSACSSYFELLFSQESEKHPIVILKDVKFQELEAAVHFMYRGEVEVCEDRLATFLEVADSLQIKGLGNSAKSKNCKENGSLVKSFCATSALTDQQQSRKDDLNTQSDNVAQSLNTLTDSEQTRKYASSSVHQSSRRESSPVLSVSTFTVGSSSCTVRKETHRDTGSLETIPQSLALHSEEIPIIKTEPETNTFLEEKLCEAEKDCEDDVTMIGDHDDWDELNTENMDAVQTNHQDTGANLSQSDDQQNFSSIFVKDEPGTSASWNQEAINYGVSTTGDVTGPSAATTAASAGVDILLMEDNEQSTPGSVQFYPPVTSGSGFNVSGKSAEESLQQTMPRPPLDTFSCPRCKTTFVRMMDLNIHMRSQSCGSHSSVFGGQVSLDVSSLPRPVRMQRIDRRFSHRNFFKCSECNFMTLIRSQLNRHVRIHTGHKPFKCPYCDYASGRKDVLAHHLRIHTGEKPYKCPRCEYACRQKGSLVYHLRTHALAS